MLIVNYKKKWKIATFCYFWIHKFFFFRERERKNFWESFEKKIKIIFKIFFFPEYKKKLKPKKTENEK